MSDESSSLASTSYTFELCITASEESSSLASTSYTFATAEHPELELLISARSVYSSFDKSTLLSPHSKQVIATPWRGVDNDDTRDDGASMDLSELDPTCMVVPTSEKAYSGVSRYKDFVRQLPVHLSKYILSWVDQVSLYNCVCVSRHWRILVEEVHNEFYVNQHLWEEVMLMQVSVSSSFSSYLSDFHSGTMYDDICLHAAWFVYFLPRHSLILEICSPSIQLPPLRLSPSSSDSSSFALLFPLPSFSHS